VLLAVVPLCAQSYSGHGYAYFGLDQSGDSIPGDILSLGAGGEGFLWKGLGAGAELGYLFPRQRFQRGLGLFAANGSYHFTNRTRSAKVVPFVTAGWGLFFRSGVLHTVNYGGGVTWWFRDRVGLRVEVRDFRHREYGRFDTALRFGISFR
jgi:hypothetical protein